MITVEPTPSWWADAKCATSGAYVVFFASDKERKDRAKAICAQCPVSAQCLEYSIQHKIRWGIFGGVEQKARRAEMSRRFKQSYATRAA
jgi:WhiB family transcriptional regulator, redox-sensing transcriptional regulator